MNTASTSFRDLSTLWKAHKQGLVKPSSFALYSLHLDKHLIPAFGPARCISEADVQAFVNSCLSSGMGVKTVKDLLIILRMVLRFGQKYHQWTLTSWDIQYPCYGETSALKILSRPQQKRLMQHLRAHLTPQNAGIALALGTGLRIGEVCALTWADIDVRSALVRVNKTVQRIYWADGHSEVRVGLPKTPTSFREVPISRELTQGLRSLKRGAVRSSYVLTGSSQPMEPGVYRAYFKRLLSRLDLPPIRFHDLRHSFATRCIECNCDYKTVSAVLGHANISTTLNLYVHPNLQQKKRCIDKAFKRLR